MNRKNHKRTKHTKLGCTVPGCRGYSFTKLCMKHWRMKYGYEEIRMGNPFKKASSVPSGVMLCVCLGVVIWIFAVAFIKVMG
jgi:hypothetical protein